MAYSAKVVKDSISPGGHRLTTMEVTFPRFILPEFNTHRAFSRNSASSRAIPFDRQVAKLEADPFVPEYWGANQPGMQADQQVSPLKARMAADLWRQSCKDAIHMARQLHELGVHKQLTNRLMEPFMWHTVLVSSTEWQNFFSQRVSPHAQPEMRRTAELMQLALDNSRPEPMGAGEWHLPYWGSMEDVDQAHWQSELAAVEIAVRCSVARCARVSYLNHDGVRSVDSDLKLYDKLWVGRHLSPLEHVATPADPKQKYGNFQGWRQRRQDLEEFLGRNGRFVRLAGLRAAYRAR